MPWLSLTPQWLGRYAARIGMQHHPKSNRPQKLHGRPVLVPPAKSNASNPGYSDQSIRASGRMTAASSSHKTLP